MKNDLGFFNEATHSVTNSVMNDLWIAIKNMFVEDGIDYLSDSNNIKITATSNGDNLITYMGSPYCVWSAPKIEMGLSDDLNTSIRCEILLKKL